tara:strand:+ start:76039 stop:76695 length:657 start_codon:yes stop_codon:yes gene_type:complete
MTSLIEENYLKALFHLSSKKGEVTVKDLSQELDIKMPTVTSMMKKFSQKGLVKYKSYKPLKLTEKGSRAAGLVIRKHRLTEMFLVEKMNFGWEEVHEIAEQIEHVKAPIFFERMDKMLGHPKFDPHGSPIPDKDGSLELKQYFKLSDAKAGDKFELQAVTNSENEFLNYLNNKNLHLGLRIDILEIEEFDGSISIGFGEKKVEVLSKKVSQRLLGEIL